MFPIALHSFFNMTYFILSRSSYKFKAESSTLQNLYAFFLLQFFTNSQIGIFHPSSK